MCMISWESRFTFWLKKLKIEQKKRSRVFRWIFCFLIGISYLFLTSTPPPPPSTKCFRPSFWAFWCKLWKKVDRSHLILSGLWYKWSHILDEIDWIPLPLFLLFLHTIFPLSLSDVAGFYTLRTLDKILRINGNKIQHFRLFCNPLELSLK